MADTDKVFVLFDGGDDLRLKCTTSIAPRLASEITANPTEAGADVTDHVRKQPKSLSLEVFVSELDGQYEAGIETYDPDFAGDHIKVRERFEQAWDTSEPLHIDLGADKGIYADMQIQDMSPTWSPGQGKSLRFTVSLQQIVMAETKTVEHAPATRKAGLAGAAAGGPTEHALYAQGKESAELGFKPTVRPSGPRLETQGQAALGYPGVDIPSWVRGQ